MNKQFVEQYSIFEQTHWWFIVRKRILINAIQKTTATLPNTKMSILNIGAAAGASSIWLQQFGDVTSVEYDPVFFSYLQEKKLPVVNASVENLPFANESFDMVCAFDVIEHVDDDATALKELLRVTSNNGQLYITVPAFNELWSNHDEVNGHKRRYNKKSFAQLLSSSTNHKVLYQTYFNSLLFAPIYVTRQIEKIFRKKSTLIESDFSYYNIHPFINKLLKIIFSVEIKLLKHCRLPIGVSLLTIIKKSSFTK
jgi:SAM-dependent methyltransferase